MNRLKLTVSPSLQGAALTLLLCLTGCGEDGPPRPEVNPASGRLTINGKPAENALVVFHPADGEGIDSMGSRPRGQVAADGNFTVTTYQQGDGIPPGEYDVAVIWFDKPNSSRPHDLLGRRYSDPAKSGIHVSIGEEAQSIDPIELTNVTIVPRPRYNSRTVDRDQVD